MITYLVTTTHTHTTVIYDRAIVLTLHLLRTGFCSLYLMHGLHLPPALL